MGAEENRMEYRNLNSIYSGWRNKVIERNNYWRRKIGTRRSVLFNLVVEYWEENYIKRILDCNDFPSVICEIRFNMKGVTSLPLMFFDFASSTPLIIIFSIASSGMKIKPENYLLLFFLLLVSHPSFYAEAPF